MKSSSFVLSAAILLGASSSHCVLAQNTAKKVVAKPAVVKAPLSNVALLKKLQLPLQRPLIRGEVRLAVTDSAIPPDDKDFAYSDLVRVHTAMGNYADAQRAVGQIASPKRRSWALAVLGKAQAIQGRDASAAKKSFELAKAAALQLSTKSDADNALADIVRFQTQTGDIAGAKLTVDSIGDFWGEVAQEHIAKALAAKGDMSLALQFLEKASKAQAEEEDDDGKEKSKWAFVALEGYAKNGQSAKAREMAASISDETLIVPAILAIRKAEKLSPQDDKVLWKQAFDAANSIQVGYERNDALKKVALAQIEANDLAGAQQTLEDVDYSTDAYDAYVALAKALAKAGRIGSAKSLSEKTMGDSDSLRIPYKSLNAKMLCEIAKVEAKTSTQMARKTFDEAIKQTDSMGKDNPNRNWAMVEIAAALAQTQNMNDAMKVAQSITIHRQKASAYASIGLELARRDDMKRADEMFLKLSEAAGEEKNEAEGLRIIVQAIRRVTDELVGGPLEY